MGDDGATPEGEADYPESGPFCRHWSDFDCTEVCAGCGHSCWHHGQGGDGACDDCECEGWEESATPTDPPRDAPKKEMP